MAQTTLAPEKNAAVAVYETHDQAEKAVKDLQRAGFDMKTLSIIGKGYETEDRVIGYYNVGDRVKHWGKYGALWGGFWGLLMGAAFLIIPGIGPVLLAGPIVAALEGAAVVGGLSVIGAALFSLGIPKDSVIRYESAIKANKFLVSVHGTRDEVNRAREILSIAGAADVNVYSEPKVEAPVSA
jgi:hypothetical protein